MAGNFHIPGGIGLYGLGGGPFATAAALSAGYIKRYLGYGKAIKNLTKAVAVYSKRGGGGGRATGYPTQKSMPYRQRRWSSRGRYPKRFRRPMNTWRFRGKGRANWAMKRVPYSFKSQQFPPGKVLAEPHYVYAEEAHNPTTAGTIRILNGTNQGSDITQRTGNKIRLLSFNYTLIFRNPVGMTPLVNPVRTMLVYDKEARGATPAITDILGTADTDSQPRIVNKGRFLILMDKLVTLNPYGATVAAAGDIAKTTKGFIPLRGLITRYDGTTSNIADISEGALWLITIADGACNGTLSFQVKFLP